MVRETLAAGGAANRKKGAQPLKMCPKKIDAVFGQPNFTAPCQQKSREEMGQENAKARI